MRRCGARNGGPHVLVEGGPLDGAQPGGIRPGVHVLHSRRRRGIRFVRVVGVGVRARVHGRVEHVLVAQQVHVLAPRVAALADDAPQRTHAVGPLDSQLDAPLDGVVEGAVVAGAGDAMRHRAHVRAVAFERGRNALGGRDVLLRLLFPHEDGDGDVVREPPAALLVSESHALHPVEGGEKRPRPVVGLHERVLVVEDLRVVLDGHAHASVPRAEGRAGTAGGAAFGARRGLTRGPGGARSAAPAPRPASCSPARSAARRRGSPG